MFFVIHLYLGLQLLVSIPIARKTVVARKKIRKKFGVPNEGISEVVTGAATDSTKAETITRIIVKTETDVGMTKSASFFL